MISFNYGAKNIDRVKKSMKCIVATCVVFCTVMTIVSQFGAQIFVNMFTENSTVSKIAVEWIKIYAGGALCLAIQYPCVDMIVGLGIPLPGAMMSLNRKVSIALLTGLLPLGLGAYGAVMAEPIGDAYSMVVSAIIFSAVIRKVLKKRENKVLINEK